jgi:RNA polymerase sigma-70 factor (ECF subfamily)
MAPDPDIAEMNLRTFLRLPSLQRSAVILKDVLGHTIEEISSAIGVSEPAAKSALQRGRVRLRELAAEPENISTPVLSHAMRLRLFVYVESFKVGDFDTVRAMLAEDVKLDLVGKFQKQGKSRATEYYAAYAAAKRVGIQCRHRRWPSRDDCL